MAARQSWPCSAVRSAGASQMRSATSPWADRRRRVALIHVGAQRQAVVWAGQAGPCAGGLVGLAVVQDVRQLVGHQVSRSTPLSPAPSMRMPAIVVTSLRFQQCSGHCQSAASLSRSRSATRSRIRGRWLDLGFGRLQDGVPVAGLSRRGTPGQGLRSRGLRQGSAGSAVRRAFCEVTVLRGQVLDPRAEPLGSPPPRSG